MQKARVEASLMIQITPITLCRTTCECMYTHHIIHTACENLKICMAVVVVVAELEAARRATPAKTRLKVAKILVPVGEV